jgi:hypothetical protein
MVQWPIGGRAVMKVQESRNGKGGGRAGAVGTDDAREADRRLVEVELARTRRIVDQYVSLLEADGVAPIRSATLLPAPKDQVKAALLTWAASQLIATRISHGELLAYRTAYGLLANFVPRRAGDHEAPWAATAGTDAWQEPDGTEDHEGLAAESDRRLERMLQSAHGIET